MWMCVGAAIPGRGGRPVGALSVSMVKAAVDADRIKRSAEQILTLSKAIAERLCGF